MTGLEKQLSEWLKSELKDLHFGNRNVFSVAEENGYLVVGEGFGNYNLIYRGEIISSFKPQINFIVYPE